MSEEIVSSEDIQFYEYLGLLEQAYYDTHVGSKAGTIIAETIKSYVNILKYKNNKLQQKVEQLENENFNIRENIHLERISLPPELTKDKDFMGLYDIPSYEDLQQKVEQLEKENKELKQPQVFIDCENMEERCGRDLYEDYLKEKIEQLKNIIKEAIRLLKKCGIVDEKGNFNAYLDTIELKDLLNILNKGNDK